MNEIALNVYLVSAGSATHLLPKFRATVSAGNFIHTIQKGLTACVCAAKPFLLWSEQSTRRRSPPASEMRSSL